MNTNDIMADYKRILDAAALPMNILPFGEFEPVKEVDDSGEAPYIIRLFSHLRSDGNHQKVCVSPITTALMVFNVLDLYLELVGETTGDSFKKRCDNINVSNDMGKVVFCVYRILRIIRNAVNHSIRSISLDDQKIEVSYKREKNSVFFLSLPNEVFNNIIQLAYSITFCNQLSFGTLPEKYRLGIYASVLDRIVPAISTMRDDFDTKIKTPQIPRIAADKRERNIHAKYTVNNGRVILDEIMRQDFVASYNIDYVLNKDNTQYIVPEEALDADRGISLLELNNWSWNDDQ